MVPGTGNRDIFAVGAMVACRAAGVAIPDEISIAGCDNTDLGATQTPALTSIRTPIVEIGRAAAQQVIARLEGELPSRRSRRSPSSWSAAAARRRPPGAKAARRALSGRRIAL